MKPHLRERLGSGAHNQAKFVPAFSPGHPLSPAKDNAAASAEASSTPVGKACMYFARGFCKHGSSCRFVHTAPMSSTSPLAQSSPRTPASAASSSADSTSSIDLAACSDQHWLLQLQTELQDLLSSYSSPITVASLPHLYLEKYGKILQSEGPDSEGNRNGRNLSSLLRLLGKLRGTFTVFERPDGQKAVNLKRPPALKAPDQEAGFPSDSPCSRQIYLTFPCESTFTEADVASHFGTFGPVNDVRIPYQQRRMFGFVTFANAAAVKAVLKHVNPHYICGSRVLVKPYRDKPKASDRHKYSEASRNLTEPSGSHKGLFDSKQLPPRHIGGRSEGTKPSTTCRSGLVQSWKPVRSETQQATQQNTQQPALKAVQQQGTKLLQQSKEAKTGEHKKAETFNRDQEAKELSPKGQQQQLPSAEEALVDKATSINTVRDNRSASASASTQISTEATALVKTHEQPVCAPMDFHDTPLPRVRLFHDEDSTPGDEAEKEIQCPSPLDDWSIDLESILPDSPFSSPKRTPKTPPLHQPPADDLSRQDWHSASLPNTHYPQQDAVPFGTSVSYMPPASPAWPTQDYSQTKYSQQMVHPSGPLDDIHYGMAFLAASPFRTGVSHHHYDKDCYHGHHSICATCRQQQVVGPNAQCTCCQQMMCSMPHLNHLLPEMGSSWHVPVNAYVRASPH